MKIKLRIQSLDEWELDGMEFECTLPIIRNRTIIFGAYNMNFEITDNIWYQLPEEYKRKIYNNYRKKVIKNMLVTITNITAENITEIDTALLIFIFFSMSFTIIIFIFYFHFGVAPLGFLNLFNISFPNCTPAFPPVIAPCPANFPPLATFPADCFILLITEAPPAETILSAMVGVIRTPIPVTT